MPDFLLNKVTGFYPLTLLKERLRCRCFLVNFARYLRYLFYRTPSGDCFCSTEKYFTNKIVKSPLKKEKQMETAGKNTTAHAEKNLSTTYITSSYPFTIQKCLYSSFICFP